MISSSVRHISVDTSSRDTSSRNSWPNRCVNIRQIARRCPVWSVNHSVSSRGVPSQVGRDVARRLEPDDGRVSY